MFDEQPSEPSTGKLSRARGRLLIGTNQYATISVTCYTRATGASDPQAIEKLGEEYLAAASGYALALGRTLASGGRPPTHIEVDTMCQVHWTGPEPRLSELSLQVRG